MSATGNVQTKQLPDENSGCGGKGCLSVVVAALLFVVGCDGYYEWQKHKAMKFCESLIPQIESAKDERGNYPTAPDPEWLKGKKIPSLIRVKHFYKGEKDRFILYFWNPGDFMDDWWCYTRAGGGGSWRNADTNKPED